MEYVPREELERRWTRVRRLMDCDSLIVLQNVDVFYLTGTLQNGVLWFPRDGDPLFAVIPLPPRQIQNSNPRSTASETAVTEAAPTRPWHSASDPCLRVHRRAS